MFKEKGTSSTEGIQKGEEEVNGKKKEKSMDKSSLVIHTMSLNYEINTHTQTISISIYCK